MVIEFFFYNEQMISPFAISILRRSNNISSMYNDNIIYLSRLFWYFQVLGHFWARIMSMHHFSRFLSSPWLLPELLEVAKWGSKPVSCFFSLVGTHTSLPMWDVDTQLEMIQYVLTIFSRWTIAHCFWFVHNVPIL